MSDNGDDTEKNVLGKNNIRTIAGPDAPEVATYPACGGIVDLRSRRTGKNPDVKTWYYRQRREGVAVRGGRWAGEVLIGD